MMNQSTVNANPTTSQSSVLSDILVDLRDETPYTVPTSITDLGSAPNSAYPAKYISPITYD